MRFSSLVRVLIALSNQEKQANYIFLGNNIYYAKMFMGCENKQTKK